MEHHQLLAALSIEAPKTLPTTVRCPICQTEQSLDVCRGHQRTVYRCRNNERCGFTGDGITLYARASRLTLRDACLKLLSESLLPSSPTILTDIDNYLFSQTRRNNLWGEFWSECQRRLLQADSAVRTCLNRIGIWESQETTCSPRWFGHLLGACSGQDLADQFDLAGRRGSRFSGWLVARHTYILLAHWSDFDTLTGFTIINPGREISWDYIGVLDWSDNGRQIGLGLLNNYRPYQEHLVACDSPVSALRMMDVGVRAGQPFPVVYCPARCDALGWPVSQRLLMANTQDSLDHYNLAMKLPDCRVAAGQALTNLRATSPNALLSELQSLSKTAHGAMAEMLMRLPPDRAAACAQYLALSATDAARVLSAMPEHRRENMRKLLNTRLNRQSVKFAQDEITSSAEGWVSARRGRILNCAFYVDRLIYDPTTKVGTAIGVVIKDEQQYEFRAPLKDVQNRTADWLSNFLLESMAGALVIQPGWANKLWPISLLFRDPATVLSVGVVGWTDELKKLVLPNMVIEAGQIMPNPTPPTMTVPGSALQMPRDDLQDYELDNLTYDDHAGACFWALFTALAINVLAPFHRRGLHGIAVVDAEGTMLGKIVRQAVEEIGLTSASFTSASGRKLEEIKQQELQSALPLFVADAWTDSQGFGRWMRLTSERNALVEVPRNTATGTSLEGGWLYLSGGQPASEVFHRLDGLWKTLPMFIAWLQRNEQDYQMTNSEMISRIFSMVGRWMSDAYGRNLGPVGEAALCLIRSSFLDRQSSYGMRLLNFLGENVDCLNLRVLKSEDAPDLEAGLVIDKDSQRVFISRSRMEYLFQSCGCLCPANKFLVDALSEARILRGTSYDGVKGYVLDQEQYLLLWAARQR